MNQKIYGTGKYRLLQEKILDAGFRVETHKVVTEDRYILTIFRIPGKLGEVSGQKKKPIILQHGFLDDAYSFLVLDNPNNLAILLANEG